MNSTGQPFQARIKGNSQLLYVVRGFDEGEAAWHLVLLDNKQKEARFLRDINSCSVNVEAYGKVLASGWGNDPPELLAAQLGMT
jgi:hypothetical protein